MSRLKLRSRLNPGALVAVGAMSTLLAMSVSAPAEARWGEKHDRAAMFERADANGDGKVTRDEVEAFRIERFSRIDADGDGLITEDELSAIGREKAARRAARFLEHMDKDSDGAISEAEFSALADTRADRMFERADADGDGAIDRDELEAVKSSWRGRDHGRHGERPER